MIAELAKLMREAADDTETRIEQLEARVHAVPKEYPHRLEYERKVKQFETILGSARSFDLERLLTLLQLRRDISMEQENLKLINKPDRDAIERDDRRSHTGQAPSMPPSYAPPPTDPPSYGAPLALDTEVKGPSRMGRIRNRVRDRFAPPPRYEAEALAKATTERAYTTTGWARMTPRQTRIYQV